MPKYHNTSLALEAKIKLQTASDKWKAVVNRVDHKTTIFLVSVTLRNDRRFGITFIRLPYVLRAVGSYW